MRSELIKLSNHLDSIGYIKEANFLDSILKKAGEEESQYNTVETEEPAEKKSSKWHRMKMTRVVEEMDKNDFNSLSFEINNYSIRVTRDKDEDCD